MIETINYYYNFSVENINELDGKYYFKYNNQDYYFVFYDRALEEFDDILKCINNLQEKGIEVNKPILNIENSYFTRVNNCDYILFVTNCPLEKYDIFTIVDNNNKFILNDSFSKLYRNNWDYLWSKKIDYFEYQIRELGLDKEVIKNSFSYYVGLAENAITYVNLTNKEFINNKAPVVWSHRRIYYPNYKLNYYNPLSFIFDIEVRDIAEYLKSYFFKMGYDDTILELQTYLKIKKLDRYLYNMLFARLLFPTYYFDVYEDVMNKKRLEDDLIKIIEKVSDYELFLKKAYFEISKYAELLIVEWIIL